MSTTSLGKSIEMKIESILLERGYKVYVPLADDHGVDCVIRNNKGEYIQIQIKSRTTKNIFNVDGHLNEIENFLFYILF